MNNDVLRLHEMDTADFETGIILNEAVNVSEQRKLNDIACLQFEHPMDDKARLIKENMLLSCSGRIYEVIRITRRMDGRDIVQVVAEDLFSKRAKDTFLPNVPDMIGKKTSYVIGKAIDIANSGASEDMKFSLYTSAELKELGMKWVGNDEFKIDFFSMDKTSFWDFLHTVIECSGRGEIYSNGLKFALAERIGRDNGVRLTLDHNMQNIDIERSTENIITKLYPFGAEDLTIKNAKLADGSKYGKEYILSPNADIYGIHEGFKDYSDYTAPDKVLAHALWEFNGETKDNIKPYGGAFEGVNEERIDIPKLTISGNMIDLSKLEEYGDIMKVELGDTVHVYDLDGTEYAERVIEGTWYPYEAHQTLISIGHMRRDMFFTLYQLRNAKRHLEAVQTANKSITTRKMQGVVNTNRNGVHSDNEQLVMDGDLLTIKDDSGRIRLHLGNLDGQFALNIYDSDGNRLKIKLGDHGSDYAFAIYDNDGNPAIYMDENGRVYFAGTLDTGKDCRIQGELRVGMEGNNTKGISFYGDSYSPDADGNYSTPYARILPYVANNEDFKGINVTGGKLCVNSIPVATKDYIDDLQKQIDDLTEKIDNLKKQIDTIS